MVSRNLGHAVPPKLACAIAKQFNSFKSGGNMLKDSWFQKLVAARRYWSKLA